MRAKPPGNDDVAGMNVKNRPDGLTLDVLPGAYAICRWNGGDPLPAWVTQGSFFSVTRTPAELSVVCDASVVPAGVTAEGPWQALAVRGPLDLNMTGVLAALTTPLALERISIFSVSTYDTDYLLVRDRDVDRAIRVLAQAGHRVARA